MIVVSIMVIIGIILCIYFIFRNVWVYEKRINILFDDGIEKYKTLPSYERMLIKYFYIWDVDKILKKHNKG